MDCELKDATVDPAPPQAPDLDIVAAARAWLGHYNRVALATVIEAWGSAPVPVGGQMLVAPDGHFMGSVSGGCVENDVIAAAEDVIKSGAPRALEFGVANETAWRAGLPCGGRIDIYVEPLGRGRDEEFLDALMRARERREMVVVETLLDSGVRRVHARIDGAAAPVRDAFRSGKSRVVEGKQENSGARVFLHAIQPPLKVLLIGATHVTQVLSQILALAGYDATVIDPRMAYASGARFTDAKLVQEWPETALPRLGLDRHTAVVTLTHVEQIDEEALRLALGTDCIYVGALGSRRTAAKRAERLKTLGFGDADLARIHAPVGLDIGAKTPAEIAVSIAAEIVQAYRGGGKSAA